MKFREQNSGRRRDALLWGESGSVSLIMGLALPVVLLAGGIAIDFNRAAALRTRLNAIADAAALAALTPTMMQQAPSVAANTATAFFMSQAASLSGLAPGSLTVSVSFPASSNSLQRIVLVNFAAQSENFFGGLEPASVFSVGGVSTAQASLPPNIDFYMLLDNSPSMGLPSTSAGVTQMQNATPQQGGCALACHNANTNGSDTVGNLCFDGSVYTTPTLQYPPPYVFSGVNYCAISQGKQIDNYAMARRLNIPLRLDAVSSGVSALMSDATSYSGSGIYSTPPKYRFAAYSIDTTWNVPTNNNNVLMNLTSDYQNAWNTASASFGVMEMWQSGQSCISSACTSGNILGIGPATNYDTAMSSILSAMPTPGNGTNLSGDTPKEILFIVTDGMEDELVNGSQVLGPINGGSAHNYCDDIKAKGIKIAILYTEYLPLTNSWFYNDYIAQYQPSLGPALQACASPNLFYDASIDTNLPQAMDALFRNAVQSATLTK